MHKRSIHPDRKDRKRRVKKLSKKWKKRTKITGECFAWRLLKGIVFIICLALFFYQSAEFLQVYYKYPTTTKIEFTYPREFEFPAITFCNSNPIKRSKFCAEYPDLCETPANIKEACEIEPSSCKDNTSNFVIPNFSLFNEVWDVIREIYYSGNTTKEFWKEWAWDIDKSPRDIRKPSNMQPVFVKESMGYLPCFTENLRLSGTDWPETLNLGSTSWSFPLRFYDIYVHRNEEIFVGNEPSLRFSIHSPFVPENPMSQGSFLRLGHRYNIYIKLEEENLLSFPYSTDCTIYDDPRNGGDPQGPRSQEMCKQFCVHSLFEGGKNMTPELMEFVGLLEYPYKLCYDEECQISSEDREILKKCKQKCKPSCRNLKYTSTITETMPDDPKGIEKLHSDHDRDKITVQIILGDRQVVVNSHVAVYDTGHLFSYIGGLMGCWLGFSVYAFAGIAENVFQRTLQWTEQIKRYLKKTSQTQLAVFSTHRSNVRNNHMF